MFKTPIFKVEKHLKFNILEEKFKFEHIPLGFITREVGLNILGDDVTETKFDFLEIKLGSEKKTFKVFENLKT